MSESRKTNHHLLALTIDQAQQFDQTGPNTSSVKDKCTKRHSTSSNGTVADSKRSSYRRRPGTTKTVTTGSDIGTFRSTQRSTASPNSMSSVNYTKTGRVSKAKKGLKVHDCECGRSYTRAEHLRRHQRNHEQEGAMACKYPGCDKTFFRSDLLQRHEERHNELGNESRRSSVSSTEQSSHPSPSTVPDLLPAVTASTIFPAVSYQQQHVMSPQPGATPFPRYNPSLFRAPQPPRTPKMASSNLNNLVFPSSQHFKSPTNDLKHPSLAYSTRHSISNPVMVDATTSGVWQESFAPSPYSCSSGYASPAPGPEYSHVYATPPYGPAVVRTRASSNASYIEQWQHGSQSPTSSVAIPYSWPSDEKNVIASSFAFMPVSYATSDMPIHASIDAMSQYTQYDPRTVIQLDAEEGLQLFPGEHYGMSQIARAYPFEQWLNSYWRLFHPAFPIVHRFTFACGDFSPMLYAAMIAIDLHYSDDAGDNRRARGLHKQCVRLLSQRQLMNRTGCDRLCDSQAIFLVEVFSQYCAQRCSKTLSPQFELMYEKLAGVHAIDPSAIFGLEALHPAPESNATDRWVQWARLSARQHLILSCYVLRSQQYTLLGRHLDTPSHILSDSLPFPAHESIWEAATAMDWAAAAQQQHTMPSNVKEACRSQSTYRYDVFQSAVLIAAYHEQINGPGIGLEFEFEQLLSQSSTAHLQLLTTKLAHLLPMRALLATSGETWILGTKLTSEEECSTLKSTLRSWVGQIWSSDMDGNTSTATKALNISVAIIKLSLGSDRPLSLGLGNDLGLFLAALTLWAAIAGATSRLSVSSFSPQRPQPTIAPIHDTRPAPTIDSHSYTATITGDLESTHVPTGTQSSAFYTSSERRSSIPYVEIFSDTSRFLTTAIDDISSFNLSSCHAGGTSLLLWVKMHLRGAFSNATDSTEINANSTGLERGELISWTVSQIERMLTRDWNSWDI